MCAIYVRVGQTMPRSLHYTAAICAYDWWWLTKAAIHAHTQRTSSASLPANSKIRQTPLANGCAWQRSLSANEEPPSLRSAAFQSIAMHKCKIRPRRKQPRAGAMQAYRHRGSVHGHWHCVLPV
jgi:hypothetical protein